MGVDVSRFGSVLNTLVGGSSICSDYEFDASAQTVKVTDDIVTFLMVVNITDGVVIYNPGEPATVGTIENKTLFLTYDTTSMDDADDLLVFCEKETIDETGRIVSELMEIGDSLKLLNLRFEEVHNTGIDLQDI
jgi:hypothetical protein